MAQNNFITRLVLDSSNFDSGIGNSIKFVRNFAKCIDGLNNGMVGLSSQERSLLLNMKNLTPTTKNLEVGIAQLEYVMNGLKKAYDQMSIHTKITQDGKLVSSTILGISKHIRDLKAELESMPKKAYISPVTAVKGGTASSEDIQSVVGELSLSNPKQKKSLFTSILGGNLAARAVMDSVRFLGRTMKEAVQANMEFEYSNATLAAVLGKTKDEISNLTAQAKMLGSTSLYSAKEITELQVVLARLGFNQDEIKDSTDAIAKLALATGVDLEKAANLTGSTLRAFGYSTKEAARVASVLGVATTKSALDMQKLTTSMSYASSVSRQAGFEIEEVVAMLGKMSDNGMQATTAGVNIRNIMLDLSDKSSKLSRAIKGVTGRNSIRSFQEFADALRKMRDAGINMDDVGSMIQRRVTPGFLNLVANTEGIQELADALKGCNGELDEMASKMENTLQGSVKKLDNAWNALMLTFSNGNGTLQETVQILGHAIRAAARYRTLQQGGDAALAVLASSDSEMAKRYDDKVKSYNGKGDKQIIKEATAERSSTNDVYKIAKALYDEYNAAYQRYKGGNDPIFFKTIERLDEKLKEQFGKEGNVAAKNIDSFSKLREYVVRLSEDMSVLDRVIERFSPITSLKSSSVDISKNKGLNIKELLKGQNDGVDRALESYALALRESAMYLDAGVITKKEYDQRVLRATEAVYEAYGKAAAYIADPDIKNKLNKQLEAERAVIEDDFINQKINIQEYNDRLSELNSEYGSLNEILKNSKYKEGFEQWQQNLKIASDNLVSSELDDKVNQAKKKYEKAVSKAALKYENQEGLDYAKAMLNASVDLATFYEELAAEDPERWKAAYDEMVAAVKKWTAQVNKLGETTSSKSIDMKILRGLQGVANKAKTGWQPMGLNGLAEKIQLGVDIPDAEWQKLVDEQINPVLKGLNLDKIRIEFETGNIEKVKSDLEVFKTQLSNMQNVTSGIGTIKSSIEDLVSAFDDGKEPFDMFLTIFSNGIQMMQSAISIYEAINKLQEIGIIITKAYSSATLDSTVSTAGNVVAKKAEASAYRSSTTSKMADAGATVINKNAWLGLAGVALSAASIAAMIAALSSMKGVGNFAEGGIVPGNSMQGDKLIAHVNSGEGILTRKGVDNLGRLYDNQDSGILIQGESIITGEQIKITYNNYAKRKGLKTQLA